MRVVEKVACSYGAAVVVGVVLLPRYGPAALAVFPPIALAVACVWTWKSAILLEQVFYTVLESAVLLVPLLIVVSVIAAVVPHGNTREARAFVESFFFAAIPEELLKYTVAANLAPPSSTSPVADPRGLLVYSVVASATFAAIENVFYLVAAGDAAAFVGVGRAIMAVPGHVSTGAIIGAALGARSFLVTPDKSSRLNVLIVPVLIHGSYNFALMVSLSILGLLLAICVDLIGFAFARRGVSMLAGVPAVDVGELRKQGLVPPPSFQLWARCMGR